MSIFRFPDEYIDIIEECWNFGVFRSCKRP